jgi:endonuclease/exonuclease/phosphatase family metal-dependent hydrolase
MKIIFWNIGYVPGLNGSLFHYATRGHRLVWSPIKIQKKLLDGIASYITHETPDLFLYSEVSLGARRNQQLHQHEYLVGQIDGVKTHGATGKYRHSLFYSLPLHGGNANGFLSKHECLTDTVHLKAGSKTLVYVVIVKDVTVVMVHLSLNKKTRTRQLLELAEIVSVVKGPLVVCGDMNIFGGVGELETLMKESGLQLTPEVPKTFPSHKPKHSLDIFLTRGIKGEVSVRTIETTISDHLPIVLEFSV